MRRTRAAFVLATAALVTAAAAPADARLRHHEVIAYGVVPDVALSGPAVGLTCGFLSVTDITGEPKVQTGLAFGGPLVPSEIGSNISVRCTVQVGPTGATHQGPEASSVESLTLPVALALPGRVDYVAPEGVDVFLCTQIAVAGVPSYWDADAQAWSASAAVPCALAISQEVLVDDSGAGALLYAVTDAVTVPLDPALCPVLEGPLVAFESFWGVVWDCPPYGG